MKVAFDCIRWMMSKTAYLFQGDWIEKEELIVQGDRFFWPLGHNLVKYSVRRAKDIKNPKKWRKYLTCCVGKGC